MKMTTMMRTNILVSTSSSSSALLAMMANESRFVDTARRRFTTTSTKPTPGNKLSDAESHPDFQGKKKKSPSPSGGANKDDGNKEAHEIQEWIRNAVKENPILLFMKGSAEQPQCGFSKRVVDILKKEGVSFASADVLSSPEIREGVKLYSSWPTLPQLYVNGEFVGGCDIVTSLHEDGSLKEMLGKVGKKGK